MFALFLTTITTLFRRVLKRTRNEGPAPSETYTRPQSESLPNWLPSPVLVEVAMTKTLPKGEGTPPWERRGLRAAWRTAEKQTAVESSDDSDSKQEQEQSSPTPSESIATIPTLAERPQTPAQRQLTGVAYLIDGWENGRFQHSL